MRWEDKVGSDVKLEEFGPFIGIGNSDDSIFDDSIDDSIDDDDDDSMFDDDDDSMFDDDEEEEEISTQSFEREERSPVVEGWSVEKEGSKSSGR